MTTNEDLPRNEYGNTEGSVSTTTAALMTGTKSFPSWDNSQMHGGRMRGTGGNTRDEHNGLRRFVCSSTYGFFLAERVGLRGYHALNSSFGKVFNVEKRWEIIREMGSGSYGFVVFVNPVPFRPHPRRNSDPLVFVL